MKTSFKQLTLLTTMALISACTQLDNDQKIDNTLILEAQVDVEEQVAQEIKSSQADSIEKFKPKKEYIGSLRKLNNYAMTGVSAVYPTVIPESNREKYQHYKDNGIKIVRNNPVSTFSIDVDTGAYSNMRRMLNQGTLPPHDAIRIEEMINYFNYDYPSPDTKQQPFSLSTELAASPWNSEAQLLHIGIQGYTLENTARPATNLTFLVDVSGSMNSPNKLGLLKSSFKLLTKNLRKQDRVAIVVYAGAAGTVLESTAGDKKSKILQSLDKLNAGGSTNGAAGINLAYQITQENFIKEGINRVIIATDGDFNVGTTNFEQLKALAEQKRKSGISLTTLGFGSGNYNDALMEQLADAGNGNYAYIDTLKEANKVLVNEMNATLMTIAKDVKIQIEFNPSIVSQYRLIGYENRVLNNEDFNNDNIDAGEIGAGHSVTALYEVILNGDIGWVEPLRYQNNETTRHSTDELATLKLRYKQPDANSSQLIVKTIRKNQILTQTSDNFKLSAAVAGFGQLLRGGKMTQQFNYENVMELTKKSMTKDNFGYRGEFLQLVSLAKSLANNQVNNVE